MKAEELQIGDWVKLCNKKGEWLDNSQVDLNLLNRQAEDIVVFEPIPITHEILKENGFKKKDVFDGWVHYESFPLIDFVLHEDDEGYYIDLMDARIKYIHQLQQAMRLCGINKEITLN